MMEEKVVALIKRMKNVSCEEHFLDNPMAELMKKRKPTAEMQSLLDLDLIMKEVGTTIALDFSTKL